MGPVAMLSNPAPGESITATALNGAATSTSPTPATRRADQRDGAAHRTVTPFTLTGTALENVELQNGAPMLLGTPLLIRGPRRTRPP